MNSRSRRRGLLLVPLVGLLAWFPEGAACGQEVEGSPSEPFRLGVADVVRISVWRNPDLSAAVPVPPDGMISLPLIGEVLVAGRTPSEVREFVTRAFSDFVTAPAVSVVVEAVNSRRVFVTGEVREPGVYDIMQPVKLMQVLAMAGGWTEFAKKDKVVILRSRGTDSDERIEVSVSAITTGKSPSDNILMVPGDTIIIP